MACQNKQSEKRHGSKNSRPLKITISCCQCCPSGSGGREKVIDRCVWSTLDNTQVKTKQNCHHSYYLVPFFNQNIQYNNSKLAGDEQFLSFSLNVPSLPYTVVSLLSVDYYSVGKMELQPNV